MWECICLLIGIENGEQIKDEGYLKYAEDLKGNSDTSDIKTEIYAINFYDYDTDYLATGVTPEAANEALLKITGDQNKVFQADSDDLLEAFAEAIMSAK